MDSSVSPKDQIWFLCVCHHISTGPYWLIANQMGEYLNTLNTHCKPATDTGRCRTSCKSQNKGKGRTGREAGYHTSATIGTERQYRTRRNIAAHNTVQYYTWWSNRRPIESVHSKQSTHLVTRTKQNAHSHVVYNHTRPSRHLTHRHDT